MIEDAWIGGAVLTVFWVFAGCAMYFDNEATLKPLGARMLLATPIWPVVGGLVLVVAIPWFLRRLLRDAFPRRKPAPEPASPRTATCYRPPATCDVCRAAMPGGRPLEAGER